MNSYILTAVSWVFISTEPSSYILTTAPDIPIETAISGSWGVSRTLCKKVLDTPFYFLGDFYLKYSPTNLMMQIPLKLVL